MLTEPLSPSGSTGGQAITLELNIFFKRRDTELSTSTSPPPWRHGAQNPVRGCNLPLVPATSERERLGGWEARGRVERRGQDALEPVLMLQFYP